MITVQQIQAALSDYFSGRASGSSIVDLIDDAVSSDAVYEYEDRIQHIILEYQDILAYYVDDPVKRLESTSYFGPDKLKTTLFDLNQDIGRTMDKM